jgi:glucose dehydrogenase
MTLRFGAFLSVALLPHPSAQNDWPAYGHDSGVGGLTATGGGIVLIAATNDARLRAFDSRTGKELWTGRLNTSGNATPVTYLGKDGQQYVVARMDVALASASFAMVP